VAGYPAVQEKWAVGNVVQATTGAPVLRWHIRQWQYPVSMAAAVARNRTAPHRHPPSYVTIGEFTVVSFAPTCERRHHNPCLRQSLAQRTHVSLSILRIDRSIVASGCRHTGILYAPPLTDSQASVREVSLGHANGFAADVCSADAALIGRLLCRHRMSSSK
jgi:hypothetical protein